MALATLAAYEGGPPSVEEMHRMRLRMERELGREKPTRRELKVGRGGLLDLMRALEAAGKLGDEVPELNKALRRAGSLEAVAKGSRDPEAALAYLQAAQQVIRVDED